MNDGTKQNKCGQSRNIISMSDITYHVSRYCQVIVCRNTVLLKIEDPSLYVLLQRSILNQCIPFVRDIH